MLVQNMWNATCEDCGRSWSSPTPEGLLYTLRLDLHPLHSCNQRVPDIGPQIRETYHSPFRVYDPAGRSYFTALNQNGVAGVHRDSRP